MLFQFNQDSKSNFKPIFLRLILHYMFNSYFCSFNKGENVMCNLNS